MAEELDALEQLEHSRKVRDWRRDQAARLGLNYIDAELFADSAGDLEELRQLIAAGCDPHIAAKIVV